MTGTGARRVLTAAQLELLRAVQNVLIPAEGKLPAAGEAGGAETVDEYLAARPELRRRILGALVAAEVEARRPAEPGSVAGAAITFSALPLERQVEALHRVEARRPDLFAALLRQTYNAYYTNPAIQKLLGEGAGPPQPHGFPLSAFDESLLQNVKKRGKLWRDA